MPRTGLRITSSLAVEARGGATATARWMALLDQIGETRSISRAARAIGLSYKAAWDAVDAMNNLAGAPLVARAVGGRGGGGTTLTPRGLQLVASWRAIAQENERFLARVNARLGRGQRTDDPATLAPDLRFLGRLAMLTSARNHFTGKVVRIRKGAVNDEVELALPGGDRIVAIVTHESAQNLGLKKGVEAIALIKASWVIVAVDDGAPLKLSARNRLAGTVQRLTRGAVNTEVVIGIAGGISVAAIITNVAAKALKLAAGTPASAIFKASSVILGVAG